MRGLFLILPFLWVSSLAQGAACCLGGGPKSFISLQRLQTYELGLSTTARDTYGRFDVHGDLESAEKSQTYQLALGAGARLTADLQAFVIVPFTHQASHFGRHLGTRSDIGDIVVGAHYTLIENLFRDEWHPTVTVTAGLKAPSGSRETLQGGLRIPGTGNGYWEPFLGVGLQKAVGPLTAAVRGSYSARLKRDDVKEGDAIELVETVSIPFSARFSLALGGTQTWILGKEIGGRSLADSGRRLVTAFVSPTYFVTRFWSITASADFAVPVQGWSVNHAATRSFAVALKHSFY